MLTYEKAIRSPKMFKALTGMSPRQFDSLYEDVEKLHGAARRTRLSSKPRARGIGAGRPTALGLKEQLIMLLSYYRTYMTQNVEGLLFGTGQATVSRTITDLEPTVRRCIPIPQKIYAAANKARTLEDLEEIIPGLALLVDASEQGICRPADDETQKKHYSGKAKRHTIKTQYTTSASGLILHTSAPVAGSMHDFALFKMDPPTFPPDLPGDGGSGRRRTLDIVDSAYTGMDAQYPDRDSRVALKRKPGKSLTREEKEYNRALSRIRIRVEHTIRRVKIFRIMGDRYRNPRRKYAIIRDIVCGLANMKLLDGLLNAT